MHVLYIFILKKAVTDLVREEEAIDFAVSVGVCLEL